METVISSVSSLLKKGRALLRKVASAPVYSSVPTGGSLGASLTPDGVKFAVHAPQADAVQVCLFEASAPSREVSRLLMERDETGVWHAFGKGLREGTLYGYRARGKWNANQGLWFNVRKLLLDPYAKAIHGKPSYLPAMQGMGPDGKADAQDNGISTVKSVVI